MAKEVYTCFHCKRINIPPGAMTWSNNSGFSWCKACTRNNAKNNYYKNMNDESWRKKRSIQSTMFNRKQKFGVDEKEYYRMLELQSSGCLICKQSCKSGKALAVDHNHKNGDIRGLLCHRCNTILGLLNDDESYILAIMDYLKHTTWKAIA